jgi:hypothetical protein
MYRDPVAAPVQVLSQAVSDLPLWLFGQFGLSVISLGLLTATSHARLIALVLVLPLLGLLLPTLRHSPQARFFALGMALCIAPLCLTLPQDRLLIGASFGGFGWLACFAQHTAHSASRHVGFWLRSSRALLLSLHLAIAPLLFAPMLFGVSGSDRASRALAAALPAQPGQDVVIVNLPFELLTLYASILQRQAAGPEPATLRLLYSGSSALSVERLDAHTLEMRVTRGFGRTPFEAIFTRSQGFPRPGQSVRLGGMTATVVDSNPDGKPTRVRYAFAETLESPRHAWLAWEGDRPVGWTPPAVGETRQLSGVSALEAMPSASD